MLEKCPKCGCFLIVQNQLTEQLDRHVIDGQECSEIARLREAIQARDRERWEGLPGEAYCTYCGEEMSDKNVGEPCEYPGCETVEHPARVGGKR